MRRHARPAVLVGLSVGAVTALALALPRLSFFRVRQLEVEGVRYLAPAQVVRALGLPERVSLFSRLAPAEERIRGMAGVVDARVARRLPGTLRIRVVEESPVAFVPGPGGLVPVDVDGRQLPYDPAVAGIDLPVLGQGDRGLLLLLARVQAADSALYGDIESARPGPRRTVILDLGGRRIMVRTEATNEDLQALGTVRRHLAGAGGAYAELDARYAGWVVLRRNRS